MLKPLEIKKQGKEWLDLTLIIIIIVIIVVVIYKVYKATKQASEYEGDRLGDVYLSNQTGVPPARLATLRAVASDIWDATTEWPVVGVVWVTDDAATTALQKIRDEHEAKLVSQFFKEKSGRSLAYVLGGNRWYTDSDKINPIVWNALE